MRVTIRLPALAFALWVILAASPAAAHLPTPDAKRDATTAPVAKTVAPASSTVVGTGEASATGAATIGTRAIGAEVFREDATVLRSAAATIPAEWALVLLVGLGLAAWIGPRRALTAGIVLLLGIFAFETGVHSVHHLADARDASECRVASAASHVTGTTVDTAAEHLVVPTSSTLLPTASWSLSSRPLRQHEVRGPPAPAV
jgi:hypothetical protein